MKPLYIRFIVVIAVSPLFASLARSDEVTYAKILKERDSVLSEIVARREAQFATGSMGDEALVAARLALWSFRRDTAASDADKLKHQALIVAAFQKKLDTQKSRAKAGESGPEDVLLATDSLLQAQQLLEELRLKAKRG